MHKHRLAGQASPPPVSTFELSSDGFESLALMPYRIAVSAEVAGSG
jgi:hypothetical protein